MKHLFYILALLSISVTQAQETFYGTQVIRYSYEGDGADMMNTGMPQSMTFYYGKDKSALEINDTTMLGMMYLLVNTPEESFIVGHNQKTVYKIDADMTAEEQPIMENISVVKVEKETKEILGFTCVKHEVSIIQMGMEMKFVMWVTNKYLMPDYKSPFNQDAFLEIIKAVNIQGMVLRLESDIPLPDANIKVIIETTKLDPTAVAENIFKKPKGYAIKNFTDMLMPRY